MSQLDLEQLSSQPQFEDPYKNSVSNPTSNEPIPVENKPTEKFVQPEITEQQDKLISKEVSGQQLATSKQNKIILDGPLSAVYAKALYERFKFTKESQAEDAILLAATVSDDINSTTRPDLFIRSDFYYVTSCECLKEINLNPILAKLERFKSTGKFRSMTVCIDSGSPGANSVSLEAFAKAQGMNAILGSRRSLESLEESFLTMTKKKKRNE